MHNPPIEVETRHLRQLDPNVSVLADHVTYRRRDLSGRNHSGRHLVEQRLEQVIVASIHHVYLDRLASEQAGRRQPTEAATDDDHSVSGASGVHRTFTIGSGALDISSVPRKVGFGLFRPPLESTARRSGSQVATAASYGHSAKTSRALILWRARQGAKGFAGCIYMLPRILL